MRIISLNAREILDSRGEPTVEAIVETKQGFFRASVPSGTSRGKYEAVESRDGGKRFSGRGVLKAVKNIEEVIAPKLKGEDAVNQKKIDEILISLDGTANKAKLGVNAVLAVSMAVCRALACEQKIPLYKYISLEIEQGQTLLKEVCSRVLVLPKPCFNVLEGGKHANNGLDIQEFMIVPQFDFFAENYQAGKKIYQALKDILVQKFGEAGIVLGMESGFAPSLTKTEQALDFLQQAIKQSGYDAKVMIGLDIAASELAETVKGRSLISEGQPFTCYNFEGKKRTSGEMLEFYQVLVKKYPILFLEDSFSQDDWQGWQKLKLKMKNEKLKILVVGDDLTVTNPGRIKLAHKKDACDAVVLKPNQIGTISETLEAAKMANDFDWKIIVSHRSGDTGDDFIADLAVGIDADFIKSGAPARRERVAKYNRLLEIEEELKIN